MCKIFESEDPISLFDTPIIYPASLYPFYEINERDIYLDIGPGRGDLLFYLARKYPEGVAIGIEIKRKRVDKLIARLNRFGIANAVIIQGDARKVLPMLFPTPRVREIHIHFPDPWPKKRHIKNRLLNSDMIRACINALMPNGELVIVTDVEGYIDWAMDGVNETVKLCIVDAYEGGWNKTFPTLYAEKWKKEGRSVFSKRYRKL